MVVNTINIKHILITQQLMLSLCVFCIVYCIVYLSIVNSYASSVVAALLSCYV